MNARGLTNTECPTSTSQPHKVGGTRESWWGAKPPNKARKRLPQQLAGHPGAADTSALSAATSWASSLRPGSGIDVTSATPWTILRLFGAAKPPHDRNSEPPVEVARRNSLGQNPLRPASENTSSKNKPPSSQVRFTSGAASSQGPPTSQA